MAGGKPTRRIGDTPGHHDGESSDQRRDRLVRELRELHAVELARAYQDGLLEGERRARVRAA